MKRKVRMLTCSVGDGEILKPGDEIALEADVAEAWVNAHLAVYVASPEFEAAVVEQVETTTLRPARKRKGAH